MKGQLLEDYLAGLPTTKTFEKVVLVDTATKLLGGCYAHLRQKRSLYGIDPLARLATIRRDLGSATDRQFQEQVFDVFASLRDLHTSRKTAAPLRGSTAVLPLLVAACSQKGAVAFLVTKVADDERSAAGLVPGAGVTHWNGVPIELAVARNAVRTRGANPGAALARSVDGLT